MEATISPTPRKTSTARSREWRAAVKDDGNARFEVTAKKTHVDALCEVARRRGIPRFEAFEIAVVLLTKWHNADVAGNKPQRGT